MKKFISLLVSCLVSMSIAPATAFAQMDAGVSAGDSAPVTTANPPVATVPDPGSIPGGWCLDMGARVQRGEVLPTSAQLSELIHRCGDQIRGQTAAAAAQLAQCHDDLASCQERLAAAAPAAPAASSGPPPTPRPHREQLVICEQRYNAQPVTSHGRVTTCRCPNAETVLVREARTTDGNLHYACAVWDLSDVRRQIAALNSLAEAMSQRIVWLEEWRDNVGQPGFDHVCPVVPDHPEYDMAQRCEYWHNEYLRQPVPPPQSSAAPGSLTVNGRPLTFSIGVVGLVHPRTDTGAPTSLGVGLSLQLNIPSQLRFLDGFVGELAGFGDYGNVLSGFPTWFAQERFGLEWYPERSHHLGILTGGFVHNWFAIGAHHAPEASGDYRGVSGGALLGIRYEAEHFFLGASIGIGPGQSFSPLGQNRIMPHVNVELPVTLEIGARF